MPGDWDRVRELGNQLPEDAELPVTDELRELLLRVAPDVALTAVEASEALSSPVSAAAFLREVHRRIRDGSRRLSRALVESYKLKQAGDLAAARQVLSRIADVEVVPLYREQVQIALDHVDAPEEETGH
ncbi:DUSAM domain-containing protein [Corallococcus sicarius]|uniref:DUSAM domain-containing protein n=1 Tax=Corallococcus sicarius TaxID=2316726 RepID=A0A3A8NZD0_9BACT|nr:DUSAM domain-containing protein [Corallococcus sicarius]RKH45452.1 DUSAM domain-containing protein [Corallococcus sicarius]